MRCHHKEDNNRHNIYRYPSPARQMPKTLFINIRAIFNSYKGDGATIAWLEKKYHLWRPKDKGKPKNKCAWYLIKVFFFFFFPLESTVFY
jgi:hypothetical protein